MTQWAKSGGMAAKICRKLLKNHNKWAKNRCFHPCHPCQWGNVTPLDVQWKNSFLDIHNHKQSWFLGPLIFDAYGRDILAAVGLEARAGAAAPVEPRSRDTEISATAATLRPRGPQSLRGPAADTTQQQHNIATRQLQLSTTFSHNITSVRI